MDSLLKAECFDNIQLLEHSVNVKEKECRDIQRQWAVTRTQALSMVSTKTTFKRIFSPYQKCFMELNSL
jgi:hypothetical protein